jgi:hypothetical protein
MVLRCQNPAGDVISDNSVFPREFAVCAAHGEAIRAGAEWRPDTEHLGRDGAVQVILMGADLTAGELRFHGYRLSTDMRNVGSANEPTHKLTLVAKRGQDEEEFTFAITSAQLSQLAKDFADHDDDRQ